MAGMVFKEDATAEKSDWQIDEMSREAFETLGRSTSEEEVMQTVIEFLQGLDATRAKVIHLDPAQVALYTRSIAAAQRISLPVIVEALRDGVALAPETAEACARNSRLSALTHPPSP